MSLQVNELRIGNILREGVVRSIASNGVVEIEKDGTKTPRRIEELNPEPLTEEWLEEKGFKSFGTAFTGKEDHKVWERDFYEICDNMFSDGVSGLVKTEHVHQLQNAWHSLTGEEL